VIAGQLVEGSSRVAVTQVGDAVSNTIARNACSGRVCRDDAGEHGASPVRVEASQAVSFVAAGRSR